MKNNYKSLIEKKLSTEDSIKESQKKIKNYSRQISFIDQNICTMGGYKFNFTINNTEICINFPTVLYDSVLENDLCLKHKPEESKLYQHCLPLVEESFAKSAFLVIRMKNLAKLLLTTKILHEFAKSGNFQLPLAIIVCSKEQLADVRNNLHEIPIPVICSTALNFIPQYGMNTDLGTEDIEKLFTQNTDIQRVFKENQFHTKNILAKNNSSFFSNRTLMKGAIFATTVTAATLTVGYLTLYE